MSKMRIKATELRHRAQKKKEEMMARWGEWRSGREWTRGLFHFSIGFAGWLMLQVIGISMVLLGYLLHSIGMAIFLIDLWRVYLVRRGWGEQEGGLHNIVRWLCNNLCRDNEKHKPGNIAKSLVGLEVAWLLCYLAEAPWIAAATCLIFSLVDPVAKVGKRWPIKKFKHGLAEGKSVGGLLFGALGGLVGVGIIVFLHLVHQPFFPPPIYLLVVCAIYFVGVVTASLVELVGGTWDNFLIPASSSIVMVSLYVTTLFITSFF